MEALNQPKKLYRVPAGKMVGGVLSGFAEYFNADVSILRIVYVAVSILSAGFPGLLVYIICWAIIPEKKVDSQ
jgi:phage shock protein C